jgi:ComF family protein
VAEPFPDKKFNTAYILFDFDRTVRLLIHLLKYKGYFTLAEYFADAAMQTFPQLLYKTYDYILPVPLHHARIRERGFNQSAILGAALGKKMGLPLRDEILIRRRNTPSQTRLNRRQRMQNVAEAFHCHGLQTGARILVIDDVITTASTMNACCLTLRRAGAAHIDAFALANPVSDGSPDFLLGDEMI